MKKVTLGAVLCLLLAVTGLAQGNSDRGDPRAFRVVDNNGKLVGLLVGDNIVAREIDRQWVQFYIHPMAGIVDSQAIYAYFANSNCSGAAYLPRYRIFLEGVRVGSKLYYPTADQVHLSPLSVRVLTETAGYDTACHATPPSPYVFGAAASIDVESLGLELPFKATQ